MPVSIAMFRTATIPTGTTALRGRYPKRAPATTILHLPGASAIRYRPAASVLTDRLEVPRVNLTTRFFAGAEHGTPAMQTGVVGPLVTTPRRPLVAAPAEPASARTRGMSTPTALMARMVLRDDGGEDRGDGRRPLASSAVPPSPLPPLIPHTTTPSLSHTPPLLLTFHYLFPSPPTPHTSLHPPPYPLHNPLTLSSLFLSSPLYSPAFISPVPDLPRHDTPTSSHSDHPSTHSTLSSLSLTPLSRPLLHLPLTPHFLLLLDLPRPHRPPPNSVHSRRHLSRRPRLLLPRPSPSAPSPLPLILHRLLRRLRLRDRSTRSVAAALLSSPTTSRALGGTCGLLSTFSPQGQVKNHRGPLRIEEASQSVGPAAALPTAATGTAARTSGVRAIPIHFVVVRTGLCARLTAGRNHPKGLARC